MSDDSGRDNPLDNVTPYIRKASHRGALAALDAVNEAHGYGAAPEAAPAIKLRGPFRTGRTAQLNLKAEPDTVRRFSAICAEYNWPSGLTMKHAVAALERELAKCDFPKGRDQEHPGRKER
jgi:hypothetical protein